MTLNSNLQESLADNLHWRPPWAHRVHRRIHAHGWDLTKS